MASGPLIGGGIDESQGNQRWTEGNVYKRKKTHNGPNPKNITESVSRQTLALENENNLSQQQLSTGFDGASVDSSSLNYLTVPNFNGSVLRLDNLATIKLSARSKQEIRELRLKLFNELDQVRNLVNQLESVGHCGPMPMMHGGVSKIVVEEKRTPKGNDCHQNSNFVVGNKKFPLLEGNKNSNFNDGEIEKHGFGMDKNSSMVFKSCGALLAKLMKHKDGWIFNTPVDVKAFGLHDYYLIIKHPMDLGTIKSRLNKNWYKSSGEFAEDVRLTFHNAMTYNPRGNPVHTMAYQLWKIFEDNWVVIEADVELRLGRNSSLEKQRDMTDEERKRLIVNLQTLPSEKIENIVQIIKKRNSTLFQNDDEIELDIDCIDLETLWELDGFVTNYTESLSKYKRKAEVIEAEMNPASTMVATAKVAKTEEKNKRSSSPVRVEKQGYNASRSSSSSCSSSDSGTSSSDSDSESSIASDGGHSPMT